MSVPTWNPHADPRPNTALPPVDPAHEFPVWRGLQTRRHKDGKALGDELYDLSEVE